MFGQQPSTPFGSPPATNNPTGFGAQTNTTPAFGGGSTFGAAPAPSTAFGGFGTPAPAPSGFGGFGAPAAPAQGGFGTTSAFGSPAAAPTPSAFGSAATTTAITPFGAPAPSAGIFGAPAPASTGLFGATPAPAQGAFGGTPAPATGAFGGFGASTNTASAFGAPAATGAFGTPAPAPALFGAPATTSTFGSTPATTSAFGAPTPAPGGIFGGGAAAPTPGLFGAPAAAPVAAGGTKIAPYQASNRVDGTSSISLQSISAMPQYESKSAEELRFEDYSAGNKGDGSGAATATGGMGFGATAPAAGAFGAPAPTSGGLFGNAPAPSTGAFGSTSAFGATPAPAAGAFGAPATSTFGAPAPATGAFGAPAPAPAFGGFGASSTPAPAPGAFGGFGAAPANAPAPLFGGGAPAPAPGALFGGAPAPAPSGLFGSAPAPAGGSLFGSSAPAPSLFGGSAPAPAAGAFGTTPAAGAFGAPAAAPTGFFGSTPAPATGFGAPAPAAGSLFGAPTPAAGGSLFGAAKPPGGGLFGNSNPLQAPTAAAPFGAAPATAASPYAISNGAVPVGSMVMPSQDTLLLQQLAAVQNQTEELKKLEVWRSGASQGPSVTPQPLSESASRMSSYSAATADLSSYRTFPKSSAQIRPRGFGPAKSPAPSTPLKSLGNGGSPIMSPNAYIGSSVKRLVIKPDSLTKKKSNGRLLLTEHPTATSASEGGNAQGVTSPLVNGRAASPHTPATEQASTSAFQPSSQDRGGVEPQNGNEGSVRSATPSSEHTSASSSKKSTTPTNGYGYDFYKQVVSPAGVATPVTARGTEATAASDFAPKLSKEGYSISPSQEELSTMSEADLAAVSGFMVSREGFGSVAWDGAVDVRGVDVDSVVVIEERDVAVYDEAEATHTKPPVGSKLNRPAVITMYKVFPKQGPDAGSEAMEKFSKKITKQTAKMGAELISYDPAKGVWKFRVQHFSRYAFEDDSESDVESDTEGTKAAHFDAGERGGHSPGQSKVAEQDAMEVAEEGEQSDDKIEDDVVALISDAESPESKILREAENAYTMFSEMDVSDPGDDAETHKTRMRNGTEHAESDTEEFPDEGWSQKDSEITSEFPPLKEIPFVSSESGIVAKLMQKSGLKSKTGSSTEYGMRMGRSFRVGWRPDGSFLQLRPASSKGNRVGTLVVGRPLYSDRNMDGDVGRSNLETHLRHSSRETTLAEGCPFFSLPKTVDAPHGTPSSHAAWCNALDDYTQSAGVSNVGVRDEEQTRVVARAFSLLTALYGVEKAVVGEEGSGSLSRRRVQAFGNWLKAACANDVHRDIRSAREKNDVHSAMLAALTGGDISQASQIAAESGYSHLSAIMSSGLEGSELIHEQVQQWHESGASSHIPSGLLRIYTLLGSDLELEEKLFTGAGSSSPLVSLDWRRRLAVLLFYGRARQNGQNSISTLIHKYDADISLGVAPHPYPRYVVNGSQVENDHELSLLYRILKLYIDGDGTRDRLPRTLSSIISPAGYSTARHNHSHAFHLAAVISSIGICLPLSSFEKGHLLHSYAAQLVDAGLWEWASYIFLCLTDEASTNELEWRRKIAKSVVLQHFRGDDPLASSRRSFLEQTVGVPSSWFEEALSERRGYVGDVHGYVTHLSKFAPDRARKAFEELMLPNLLFVSTAEESMKLLELFGSEDGTLAAAAFELYRLSMEVQRLARADPEEGMDSATQLIEHATRVQAILHEYKTNGFGGRPSGLRMRPGYRALPMSSFLSEAISALSFVMLQLKALKAGVSITDDRSECEKSSVVRMKVASQLAYISAESLPLDQHGSSVDDLLMGSI